MSRVRHAGERDRVNGPGGAPDLEDVDAGPPLRVLLVASAGGHLAHLTWLRPWWSRHTRTWVTFDRADARARLAGEDVVWAHHPTNRHPGNLVRNTALAWRTVRRVRPDVVVSTGGGVALPFLGIARAVGAKTAFLEVYDRVDTLSLTGRLVAPWVDGLLLQHEAQQVAAGGRGTVLGPIR